MKLYSPIVFCVSQGFVYFELFKVLDVLALMRCRRPALSLGVAESSHSWPGPEPIPLIVGRECRPYALVTKPWCSPASSSGSGSWLIEAQGIGGGRRDGESARAASWGTPLSVSSNQLSLVDVGGEGLFQYRPGGQF